MLNHLFAIFIIFFISSTSYAKFLVEPRLEIVSADFSQGSEDGSYKGTSTAINLGYAGDFFMAGIAIAKSELEFDSNESNSEFNKARSGGIGTFLGFHFWNKLRIMTTYLNSTLEPTNNNDIRYFGQYISFGLGYRIWNGLMLNYDQFSNHFTQLEDDTSGKTTGLTNNIKNEGHKVSLSYILIF